MTERKSDRLAHEAPAVIPPGYSAPLDIRTTPELIDAWAALGTPEQIRETISRLQEIENVDMCGKRIALSVYAVGATVRVLVHEVVDGSVPLIGAIQFSPEQWCQIKAAVDPLVEGHQKLLSADDQ